MRRMKKRKRRMKKTVVHILSKKLFLVVHSSYRCFDYLNHDPLMGFAGSW